MKKIILYSLTIILFSSLAGIADSGKGSFKVLLRFKTEKGKAVVTLFNSKENYSKSQNWFRQEKVNIKGDKAEVTFAEVPFGAYAIKVYQDKNENGKLDTGLFGIPKEPYGFSNNVRGSSGPAKWEDAKFLFNNNELIIMIDVN